MQVFELPGKGVLLLGLPDIDLDLLAVKCSIIDTPQRSKQINAQDTEAEYKTNN